MRGKTNIPLLLLYLLSSTKVYLIYAQDSSTKCSEGEQIQYIVDSLRFETFDQAEASCQQRFEGSILAEIPDQNSFNQLNDFLVTLRALPRPVETPWIGLRRPNQGENGLDPSSFFLENPGSFGDVSQGEFPWNTGGPNNAGGTESCVQ